MFTGIIRECGYIRSIKFAGNSAKITVECNVNDIKLGDSISVNGVCLTAASFYSKGFIADVSGETLNRTSLKHISSNKKVNIEHAIKIDDKLGGHLVQGHVDNVGHLQKIAHLGDFFELIVDCPELLRKYIAEKGSVALDGISLTVAKDYGDSFSAAVIPHTYANTNLSILKIGDVVNIEVDVIARYTEKLLRYNSKESRLESLLSDW
ncbi:riboflavin synthase [Alphaproteobacteria bacterium]|nr:riboflavin synthase [Alphaproteobacteria bacterium]